MAKVVEAICPGCKNVLRVPGDWVNSSLRCKKCGTVVRLPQRSSDPAASFPPAVTTHHSPLTTHHSLESTPEASTFALGPSGPIIRSPAVIQHSRGFRTGLALLAAAIFLVTVTAVIYWLAPQGTQIDATIPVAPKKNRTVPPVSESAVFPRRALAICVNDYVYADSVSSPNVHALMQRLAKVLHVPPLQVYELSDATPGAPRILPLKATIESAVVSFLETSRAQDRVLVLFVGHAVEKGGEAFLVPLEGDPTATQTLIPLAWLYDQLARCRARQKVLILDICRFDPNQGSERPGSGPMAASIDALLQKPPPGVQVWSACTAGQYSYASYGNAFFLDKLDEALTPSVLKKTQGPQDALPIEALAEVVNQSTATEVATRISTLDGQKALQTPRLTGQPAAEGASYDKDEPSPPSELAAAPQPAGGLAKREQVENMLQEIRLPPLKAARRQHSPEDVLTLLPYSAEVINRYRPDYHSLSEIEHDSAKYPLRAQVIETIKLLRATFDHNGPQGSLREYFQGTSNERIKAEILKEQRKPALVHDQLMERLEALRKAGEQRDKEPSLRWQAHYDYILAELLARTAYVSEYNLMLGKIRKDELPELQPKVHTGWRLVASEKMQSSKEVKDLAAESKKLFAKIIREHPGTPWEILAKREQRTALGLEWQPSS
jgi:hypothetical protein